MAKKPAKKVAKAATKNKRSTAKKPAATETTVKHPIPNPDNRPTGRGGVPVPIATKGFSKQNQPTSELKKAGWAKRRQLRDLLDMAIAGPIGKEGIDYTALTAKFYGIDKSEVSVRMVMEYRQIEKGILKGDTAAFTAVMDRGLGRATQQIELIPDMTIKINGKKVTK